MRCSAILRVARGLFALVLVIGLGIGYDRHAIVLHAGGPWYVSAAGQNTNDCLSPTTTCKTIAGAISKAASGDTINIAAGTYGEDIDTFNKNLTLHGAGSASTIIAPGEIYTNAILHVSGLAVRNGGGIIIGASGNVTLSNIVLSHNTRGIYNDGTLIATNATIEDNTVSVDVGGGMWNRVGARATLTNVSIRSNKAQFDGGGILNTGTLTLTNAILSMNVVNDTSSSSSVGGGAIFNDGDLRFTNGIVINNRAGGHGGGIVTVQRATLSQVTVSGNQASFGAGIENYYLSDMAAVLTMTNSTISGNIASSGPGGGLLSSMEANVTNVTISNNVATEGSAIYNYGTMRLKNTIVNGSCHIDTAIASLGHNLDSGTTCDLKGTGDLKNANPNLGPLQNNGGFSATHALLARSPAIDAGADCPATDQRGVARPFDGNGDHSAVCDIGAYELNMTISSVFLPLITDN